MYPSPHDKESKNRLASARCHSQPLSFPETPACNHTSRSDVAVDAVTIANQKPRGFLVRERINDLLRLVVMAASDGGETRAALPRRKLTRRHRPRIRFFSVLPELEDVQSWSSIPTTCSA
jgi:hypothetical protein